MPGFLKNLKLKYIKEKRYFCAVSFLALLLLIFAGCVTTNNYDYKGDVTNNTPYDIKYKKVQEYLEKAANFRYERDKVSQKLIKSSSNKDTIRDKTDFWYPFVSIMEDIKKDRADYWQLPEETEKKGRGDCEDKAIWLYSKLIKEGFTDVRLVIGKYRESSPYFHAWVVWYQEDKIFILDPTKNRSIWELRDYPAGYYQPYYSYYKNKKWRHTVIEK